MKIPLAQYRDQHEANRLYKESLIKDHGARFEELGEERAGHLPAKARPQGQLYYTNPDHGQTIEEL
jgi:hypothetical protein